MPQLLIAEDDAVTGYYLASICTQMGFEVTSIESLDKMTQTLDLTHFDVVLLDIWLGQTSTLPYLGEWVKKYPTTAFIVLTAHGTFDMVVEAMRCGASHFFVKPIDPTTLYGELSKHLKLSVNSYTNALEDILMQCGMVGQGHSLKKIAQIIAKVKDLDSPVLIHGESGAGKELVARGLHGLSQRKNDPFEAVNCAFLPVSLIEGELFGYAKGAFTDAKSSYQGVFERGKNGTVFLDEIGELPLPVQAKLLRVLQERVYRPLGSQHSLELKARIITATNRNLLSMIREGIFRPDLYYRIRVIDIQVPPLRSRPEDIPMLAQHFCDLYAQKFNKKLEPMSSDLLARLTHHSWPGNIRELQNAVERAIALCDGQRLELKDFDAFLEPSLNTHMFSESNNEGHLLPHHLGATASTPSEASSAPSDSPLETFEQAKMIFEKNYLQKVLVISRGNVTEAAKIAGKFRSDFYRMLNKHHIDASAYRSS